MERFLTRRFAASRAVFEVACPSEYVRDAVEALLVDLDDSAGPVTSRVEFEPSENDGLILHIDGERRSGSQRLNGALASLVTAVSRLALDADPAHLHLHCAGLSRGDQGVLISAASGTGKTTVAAGLALRNWTYVSDEAIAFNSSRETGHAFPKPLMIKPGGGALVSEIRPARIPFDEEDQLWWHVPASAVTKVASTIAPSVIVVLERVSEDLTIPSITTDLHPADAVVALMNQTMDSQRFGPAAVGVLARLTANCKCIALSVGPVPTACDALERGIVEAPRRYDVHELVPSEDDDLPWVVAASVRSYQIGDRGVAHDTEGGAIVAFDEAGLLVWNAFHGLKPPWWSKDAATSGPVVEFMGQLADLGLLIPGAEEPS